MRVLAPRTILNRAAALIERDGWQTGGDGPNDPDVRAPHCLMGAVCAQINGNPDIGREATPPLGRDEQVFEALADELRERGVMIATRRGAVNGARRWNDIHARDARQVIDVLRAAARRAPTRANDRTAVGS